MPRRHKENCTLSRKKTLHFFVDNQRFSAEKLYTPEESGHSVPLQVYSFVVMV